MTRFCTQMHVVGVLYEVELVVRTYVETEVVSPVSHALRMDERRRRSSQRKL